MGEPLYLDVLAALAEHRAGDLPLVVGGRYGLGSKEFTPADVKGVFDELAEATPRRRLTVGIVDDIGGTSVRPAEDFRPPTSATGAILHGLGSDGMVGASKTAVKVLGEHTDLNAQGYFVYDSKKSGSHTVSHLRFGPDPIESTYLVDDASLVVVSQVRPDRPGRRARPGGAGSDAAAQLTARSGRAVGPPDPRAAGPDRRARG